MSRKRFYLAGAALVLLLVAVAACSTGGEGGGEIGGLLHLDADGLACLCLLDLGVFHLHRSTPGV